LYDNHTNQEADHRVPLDVITKWREDGIDGQRQNEEESRDVMKVRIDIPQEIPHQFHSPRQAYHGNILKGIKRKSF
jgi:hypothetical protein